MPWASRNTVSTNTAATRAPNVGDNMVHTGPFPAGAPRRRQLMKSMVMWKQTTSNPANRPIRMERIRNRWVSPMLAPPATAAGFCGSAPPCRGGEGSGRWPGSPGRSPAVCGSPHPRDRVARRCSPRLRRMHSPPSQTRPQRGPHSPRRSADELSPARETGPRHGRGIPPTETTERCGFGSQGSPELGPLPCCRRGRSHRP